MEAPEPEESGTWLQRRGTDLAVWVLVILAVIGFAAGAAWYLKNASFKLREVTPGEAPQDEAPLPVPDPAAAPPVQTAPPTAPSRTVEPVWLTRPAPAFPERAARAGVQGGVARVTCVSEVSGRLSQCRITSESPAGYDFGANAVAAASQGRVRPRQVNGVASRSTISFTIRYRIAP